MRRQTGLAGQAPHLFDDMKDLKLTNFTFSVKRYDFQKRLILLFVIVSVFKNVKPKLGVLKFYTIKDL